MKIFFSLLFLLIISCTDSNVQLVRGSDNIFSGSGNIYSVDDGFYYLKRITIEGDRIYIVVNKDGQPVASASAVLPRGKYKSYVASVVVPVE